MERLVWAPSWVKLQDGRKCIRLEIDDKHLFKQLEREWSEVSHWGGQVSTDKEFRIDGTTVLLSLRVTVVAPEQPTACYTATPWRCGTWTTTPKASRADF